MAGNSRFASIKSQYRKAKQVHTMTMMALTLGNVAALHRLPEHQVIT